MLTSTSLTLVLGATGKTGSRVANRLLSRGLPVRTAAAVAGGVPAEYGAVLSVLTETIASGHGSRPNSDVEKATGAAPVSFADFARRTAAAWAVDEAR